MPGHHDSVKQNVSVDHISNGRYSAEMSSPISTYHHGDLRNALLDAALQHIQQQHEVSFTLRELAKTLGVSAAAPFRHFASKRALLAALACAGYERLSQRFGELEQQYSDQPVLCLQQQGVAYVEFAVEHQAYFLAMNHAELTDKSDLPDLEQACTAAFVCMQRSVAACAEQGLLAPCGPEAATLAAWSAVHGLALLLIGGQLRELGFDDTPASARQVAAMVTAACGFGFLAPPLQQKT
jgi:AcrR family transcriptional regulator